MWYCVVSSFIFLTNAISAYMYSQYLVGSLWLFLMMTSVLYHSIRLFHTSHLLFTDMIIRTNQNNYLLHLVCFFDMIAVYVILTYVLYNHFRKMLHTKFTPYITLVNISIFSLLGYIAFIYWYGEHTRQYCFHKYSSSAEKWHSTIHLSGSFAHHLTLLL